MLDARRGRGCIVQAAVDVDRSHVEAVRPQTRAESLELFVVDTRQLDASQVSATAGNPTLVLVREDEGHRLYRLRR